MTREELRREWLQLMEELHRAVEQCALVIRDRHLETDPVMRRADGRWIDDLKTTIRTRSAALKALESERPTSSFRMLD